MRLFGSWKRALVDVAGFAILLIVLWSITLRMPGPNRSSTDLAAVDGNLRGELKIHVDKLAGEIGERNMRRYAALGLAADYIEKTFAEAGLKSRRDSFAVGDVACHNIEAVSPGTSSDIVLIGAHYDSVLGAPGANDNASGVAAVLALAKRFAGKPQDKTLRFVAFVNEEPPYFQTANMGSLVYAGRCKEHGDRISAMISLETIGYFSDKPRSQTYPLPILGAFYSKTGNFIGFVGNVASRALLRKSIESFRKNAALPTEGAALPSFVPGVGWSDHWAFAQHGYPAIMVTDTAPFRYPHYHQATDTPDKLDYDRFALVVGGMEKVVSELAANRP